LDLYAYIDSVCVCYLGVQESEQVLADTSRYTPELLVGKMARLFSLISSILSQEYLFRLRMLHKQLQKKVDRKTKLEFLENQLQSATTQTNTTSSIGPEVTADKYNLILLSDNKIMANNY